MTQAYDTFLRQYHARGREKADGYFPACFDGLADDERPDVWTKLLGEGQVAWLFHLDAGRALAVCLEIATREPDAYRVHALLLDATGDPAWQRRMIASYPRQDPRNRGDVVRHVLRTPDTRARRAFLREVALDDSDPSAARPAAAALIRAHLPAASRADDDAARACIRQMHASTGAARRQLLEQVERGHPLPPALDEPARG